MTGMTMPHQTWYGAAAGYLGMWLAMMVPMMLPSLVTMLARYRRSRRGAARGGRAPAPLRVARAAGWPRAARGRHRTWMATRTVGGGLGGESGGGGVSDGGRAAAVCGGAGGGGTGPNLSVSSSAVTGVYSKS